MIFTYSSFQVYQKNKNYNNDNNEKSNSRNSPKLKNASFYENKNLQNAEALNDSNYFKVK